MPISDAECMSMYVTEKGSSFGMVDLCRDTLSPVSLLAVRIPVVEAVCTRMVICPSVQPVLHQPSGVDRRPSGAGHRPVPRACREGRRPSCRRTAMHTKDCRVPSHQSACIMSFLNSFTDTLKHKLYLTSINFM